MYQYVAIKEYTVSDANTMRITYGIKALSINGTQITEKLRIPDIHADFDTVAHIATLCTKEQLDPIHLPDVIHDLLWEQVMTL